MFVCSSLELLLVVISVAGSDSVFSSDTRSPSSLFTVGVTWTVVGVSVFKVLSANATLQPKNINAEIATETTPTFNLRIEK